MAKKSGEKPTKVAMVRDALEKLGWKAKTVQLQEYIKQTYGETMTAGHISQTKSSEKKRQGKAKRKNKNEVAASAPAPAKVADILSFVDTIRKREEKLGKASVKEIIKNVVK